MAGVKVFLLKLIVLILLFHLVHLHREPMECGVRKIKTEDMILRGQNSKAGQFPWHVAIHHRADITKRFGEYACGGSIISQLYVITAGHCVKDSHLKHMNYRLIFVILGIHDLDDTHSARSQKHEVLEVHLYAASPTRKNDIALIELRTVILFTDYIQPVCINTDRFLIGQTGTVPGWGRTESSSASSLLQFVELPVLDTNECLEGDREFGSILDTSVFCAGYLNGTGVCNGDSGGGLVFKRGQRWYLGGLVSFSATEEDGAIIRCKNNGFAAFTNIYAFLPWIKNITNFSLKEKKGNASIASCTTPAAQLGSCVPIQRCNNIWSVISSPTPMPQYDPYIRAATCTLPGVKHSVCCQQYEVDPKLPMDCGVTLKNRIAHGNRTKVFQYPWMAVLRYKTRSGAYIDGCGGSLISERYVLTAAHCIKARPSLTLESVRLGEHDKRTEIDCNIYKDQDGAVIERDCADPVEVFKVESSVFHPDYNRPKYSNDIGLILLDGDVIFKDHIQPICLPVTPELQTTTYERYIVTGWGTTESQPESDVLQEVLLPRVGNELCQQKMTQNQLKIQLNEKQMCAGGENNASTCRGDGGGPLGLSSYYNGLRFVQYGVNSASMGSCGLKSVPNVYTRVASYIDWILENIVY